MGLDALELVGADVAYDPGWLPEGQAARLFDELSGGTAWRQDTITLYGKTHLLPRLQAWFGDPGASYGYSGMQLDPLPWSQPLRTLRDRVHATLGGEPFNSCLLNLYRDGRDSNGWHADDEPELGELPDIVSVSLGATRRFRLRPRERDRAAPVSLDLASGSLLVMRGTTQRDWQHTLTKTARSVGPRINATFRRIRAGRSAPPA